MDGKENARQQTGLKLTCLACGQANRVAEVRLTASPKCGVCGAPLMTETPAEISLDVLKKAERIDQVPLVVDFWAAWCGPCRMMAPEFARAAEALKGRARFAKLDTEAYPASSSLYGIRGIPLLIAFQGGQEIGRRTGVASARDIADWVATSSKNQSEHPR